MLSHPTQIFKATITGECKRYLRFNTRCETYAATIANFKRRLQKRNYPVDLINKTTTQFPFSNRQSLLNKLNRRRPQNLEKTNLHVQPPPKFNQLKTIILQIYDSISTTVPTPRFASLAYPILKQLLVRAEVKPMLEQLFDILVKLEHLSDNKTHETPGKLPQLRNKRTLTHRCKTPRCRTCPHLNCSSYFSSTTMKQRYPIWLSTMCTSKYVIYLIMCTKCHKQYISMTTTLLRTRMNYHQSVTEQYI